jgi:hypothetical protein
LKWYFGVKSWGISTVRRTEEKLKMMLYAMVGIKTFGYANILRSEKIPSREGMRTDFSEIEIGALEGRFCGWWEGGVTDVEGFGGEEEIEDELDAIGYGECPVDPLPAFGMEGDESHDEGARGRAVIIRM